MILITKNEVAVFDSLILTKSKLTSAASTTNVKLVLRNTEHIQPRKKIKWWHLKRIINLIKTYNKFTND